MIVTFVSECHKNSLKLTRKVLDAYAHRIGQRTWQTVITEKGLQAIRERLSSTARKTTAVACHRLHGTRRSELLWIVGNREVFDETGNIPVHYTTRDLLDKDTSNDWLYLKTLKCIVAMASLFHDFGKAWIPFQNNLKPKNGKNKTPCDPWRHEWISMLLFIAFVDQQSDEQWTDCLHDLHERTLDERKRLSDLVIVKAKLLIEQPRPMMAAKSPLVSWIAWLIVSHHRLPKSLEGVETQMHEQDVWNEIQVTHDYVKTSADKFDSKKHWVFESSLPFCSASWCQSASRWGRKLRAELNHPTESKITRMEPCQRLLLTLGRMLLMQGDHEYSSRDEYPNWNSDYEPYANTYSRPAQVNSERRLKGDKKQRLDEHLVKVTEFAVKLTHRLPAFERFLPTVQSLRPLRKPSKGSKFAWQNRVVQEVRKYRDEHRTGEIGFFAVNMASTGMGKTFANAKIMDALNRDGLRFSLLLGLRTLTLQTGDEYQSRLGLDRSELAVLIGSAAIRDLRELHKKESSVEDINYQHRMDDSGSESERSVSDGLEFAFDDLVPADTITTVLSNAKSKQLLKSPILVCTIDHLMPAVESCRGGMQILPMLRMISSDIVIDEVDDFSQQDMPAIARLVHLAGMLGRKVMISSATIPTAVANGLFMAYEAGFAQFAEFRGRKPEISALWVDEYSAKIHDVSIERQFNDHHQIFVEKRAKKLAQVEPAPRKASIITMPSRTTIATETNDSRQTIWFQLLLDSVIVCHRNHFMIDAPTKKQWSVGVVRFANVDPCIDFSRFAMQCKLPEDVDFRILTYHARQVLFVRSKQEAYLDQLLNRKGDRCPSVDPLVRNHLFGTTKPNMIFLVAASPVVEVGRDHDYDWAVMEPSSYRSIIQMAGRVRRHREAMPEGSKPNVAIAQFNRLAFTSNQEVVFTRPGFETSRMNLRSKSMFDLVDTESTGSRLDASARIVAPDPLRPTEKLADLEHAVLGQVLDPKSASPKSLGGWINGGFYLTDYCQRESGFRSSIATDTYNLFPIPDDELRFCEFDAKTGRFEASSTVKIGAVASQQRDRLWLEIDCQNEIERLAERLGESINQICEKFGSIELRSDCGLIPFEWTPETGARRV